VVLQPLDDGIRTHPTTDKTLAKSVQEALQARCSDPSGRTARHVVRARRTARGDIIAELTPAAMQHAQQLATIDLAGLGTWQVGEWRPETARPHASIVLPGVPLDWTMEAVKAAFIEDNEGRFEGFTREAALAALRLPTRLKRRLSDGPQAGLWVESTSVRLDLPADMAAALLAVGTAVFDLGTRFLRPFRSTPTRCARCHREGHKAQFCRNPPHCSTCGTSGDHATRDCPDRSLGTGANAVPRANRRAPRGSGSMTTHDARRGGAAGARRLP
jgi:hypothetical protein